MRSDKIIKHLHNQAINYGGLGASGIQCYSVFRLLLIFQATWGVQVVRYPNFFFSGMKAHRKVKVVGGDVAVL